ncbi:MAG: hypothetical protein SWZ49_08370 [Cyanobacteriota bacterium]|nr:hypothetical protein [Cyanobacteriota bacterium]
MNQLYSHPHSPTVRCGAILDCRLSSLDVDNRDGSGEGFPKCSLNSNVSAVVRS